MVFGLNGDDTTLFFYPGIGAQNYLRVGDIIMFSWRMLMPAANVYDGIADPAQVKYLVGLSSLFEQKPVFKSGVDDYQLTYCCLLQVTSTTLTCSLQLHIPVTVASNFISGALFVTYAGTRRVA